MNLGNFKTSVSELDQTLYLIAHFDDDFAIKKYDYHKSNSKIVFIIGTSKPTITLAQFITDTYELSSDTDLYIQKEGNTRLIFGYHLRGQNLILE